MFHLFSLLLVTLAEAWSERHSTINKWEFHDVSDEIREEYTKEFHAIILFIKSGRVCSEFAYTYLPNEFPSLALFILDTNLLCQQVGNYRKSTNFGSEHCT
jgi:hypothetical protein